MNASQFEKLLRDVNCVQRRKRQGLISKDQLCAFVRLIESAESTIRELQSVNPSRVSVRATLAAPTRDAEYDHLNTPTAYCGPYTAAQYEGGQYRIERIDSYAEWYEAPQKYDSGVALRVTITVNGFLRPTDLIRIIGVTDGKADLQWSYIWLEQKDMLTFEFTIPMDRLA